MASPERGLSHDSTIYSYQLVKKVTHSPIIAMLFALFFLLAMIGNVLQDRAFSYIVCFPVILVLHMIVGQIYLRMVHPLSRSEWGFSLGVFWLGMVPANYYSISMLMKMQFQILLGSLLVIGTLYPWLGTMHVLNLIFAHLWVLIPRFIVMYSLRPYKRSGMIKIGRRETSCYLP